MTRSLRVFIRHTKQSLESLVGRKISQQGIKKLTIIFFIFFILILLYSKNEGNPPHFFNQIL